MFELKTETLESHEALLTIEVSDEALQTGMQKAARQISRETNIPGFRKGKAPYSIVVQTFGENAVRQEAADILLEEIYPQAIEEAGIDPYGPGQLEDMTLDPMGFKIRVPLQPVVDLGDYESIRKAFDTVEVTDEELEEALENIRTQNAVLEAVDRGNEIGDQVKFESINAEVDGQVFYHDHDVQIVLENDEPVFVPGFVEAVTGLQKGETKTFTLTLPEDFEDESLQGQEAEFSVEVEEVYKRTLPDLDDALASTVGSFETLDEMKESLKGKMLDYKNAEAHDAYRTALVEELTNRAEVKYPPVLEEEELDGTIEQLQGNIERKYGMEWEDFLRLQGKTEEQVREELRPDAIKRLKEGLVLNKFAAAAEIEVAEDEIKAELRDILQSANITESQALDQFDPQSKIARELRLSVLGRKTLEHLERLAQGLPAKEEASETDEEDAA